MSEFFKAWGVSEEQKVVTLLFASTEKFFDIREVVDNSRFRSLQRLLHITSCQVACGELEGKFRERQESF